MISLVKEAMLAKLLYKTLHIPNLMNIDIHTPKKYRATIIFLHGIGVSKRMWRRIERDFRDDCQIIKVDLLGFGDSAAQEWLNYSLEDQAKSLFLTLFKNNKFISLKPVIVVGHSLGSLIATEFVARYGMFVNKLVLVSPPIYLRHKNLQEQILTKSYTSVLNNDQLLAVALKIGQTFFGYTSNMSEKSRLAFSKSLRTAIIKQNTFTKLTKIKIDTYIIYGIFDPFLVPDTLKILPAINPRISLETSIAMHSLRRNLTNKIINRLNSLLKKVNKK